MCMMAYLYAIEACWAPIGGAGRESTSAHPDPPWAGLPQGPGAIICITRM